MTKLASTRWRWARAIGLAAALLAAQWVCAANERRAAGRPNVVLVMTDDQGYGDLGCHGNPWIRTPNLDRLYRESVRLTDFHVSPLCTPTRAALLTGQNPVRLGAWGTTWGRSLPRRDAATVAGVFAASGYRTGCFGKWHLGDNYPFRPQDRGFGEVLIHGGGGVGQTPDYWDNDYFDDTYFHNGQPEKCRGYCTDVWFDAAIRFIEANRDRPFFAYVPTNAPHGPFHVDEKYSGLYAENPDVPNADFYGMITNLDENMGRLVAKLDELGLAEKTILIFTTDNGTAAGFRGGKGFNAGMRGAKGALYDGGHRVPCFLRWPGGGLTGPRDVDVLAAHVDVLPTLAELCDLEVPPGAGLDGVSLAPVLLGKSDRVPDRQVFVQFRQSPDPPEKWKAAVLSERWRLIGGEELYDIDADPGQKSNVADRHPEVVRRLREAYESWWAEVSPRFDEYCEIVLGADEENPARLTGFDWYTTTPWNQRAVRAGVAANGFWAVEIARDGTYEIALRRWPEEVGAPITAAIPGGKAIAATTARLKIGDLDLTKPIPENAAAVTFRVELAAGKTKLQTWLVDDASGESRGAYYVYVERVGE
ncbi:MAG TPA: arylsulfatase [Thermoguttaceae bacterium]|nr:arylsulfatase [Thermoguttaceae bacterium]